MHELVLVTVVVTTYLTAMYDSRFNCISRPHHMLTTFFACNLKKYDLTKQQQQQKRREKTQTSVQISNQQRYGSAAEYYKSLPMNHESRRACVALNLNRFVEQAIYVNECTIDWKITQSARIHLTPINIHVRTPQLLAAFAYFVCASDDSCTLYGVRCTQIEQLKANSIENVSRVLNNSMRHWK